MARPDNPENIEEQIKQAGKKFDKLEPKPASKTTAMIRTAKDRLYHSGSNNSINKYKEDSLEAKAPEGPAPERKESKKPSMKKKSAKSHSVIEAVVATATAPISSYGKQNDKMNQSSEAASSGAKKNEQQPNAAPSPSNPKSLKEKSAAVAPPGKRVFDAGVPMSPNARGRVTMAIAASSTALRVGPFAAIRENELKRKKKASLDLQLNEEN